MKEIGDYTSQLHERLAVRVSVKVEAPYGCFDFNDQRSFQSWAGARIGITHFISQIKRRAQVPGQQVIDLFHTTTDYRSNCH